MVLEKLFNYITCGIYCITAFLMDDDGYVQFLPCLTINSQSLETIIIDIKQSYHSSADKDQ